MPRGKYAKEAHRIAPCVHARETGDPRQRKRDRGRSWRARATAFAMALAKPGPHLIHVHIRPGSLDDLGRPTLSPREVADRFKAFLAGPNSPAG